MMNSHDGRAAIVTPRARHWAGDRLITRGMRSVAGIDKLDYAMWRRVMAVNLDASRAASHLGSIAVCNIKTVGAGRV